MVGGDVIGYDGGGGVGDAYSMIREIKRSKTTRFYGCLIEKYCILF